MCFHAHLLAVGWLDTWPIAVADWLADLQGVSSFKGWLDSDENRRLQLYRVLDDLSLD